MKKKLSKHTRENLTGYGFIAPQMLLFLVFIVYPIFEGMRMSMFKIKFSGEKFIGFQNYSTLFADPVFIKSIVNTLIFVVAIVGLTVVFGIFVAATVFDKNPKFVFFIRTSYYIPVMVSMVVMSMVWNFLLNPANGLINYLLRNTSLAGINFLGDPRLVMPTLIFVTFMTNFGQAVVLYIAAMIGITKDVFEAAKIDGAKRMTWTIKILIPLVRPSTLFITVTNIISVLKIFVVIQMLTDGGPSNASVTMMYYLYNNAFKYNKLGIAAAVGVIMFFIAFAMSLPLLKPILTPYVSIKSGRKRES